jgi:hypothetical protein
MKTLCNTCGWAHSPKGSLTPQIDHTRDWLENGQVLTSTLSYRAVRHATITNHALLKGLRCTQLSFSRYMNRGIEPHGETNLTGSLNMAWNTHTVSTKPVPCKYTKRTLSYPLSGHSVLRHTPTAEGNFEYQSNQSTCFYSRHTTGHSLILSTGNPRSPLSRPAGAPTPLVRSDAENQTLPLTTQGKTRKVKSTPLSPFINPLQPIAGWQPSRKF